MSSVQWWLPVEVGKKSDHDHYLQSLAGGKGRVYEKKQREWCWRIYAAAYIARQGKDTLFPNGWSRFQLLEWRALFGLGKHLRHEGLRAECQYYSCNSDEEKYSCSSLCLGKAVSSCASNNADILSDSHWWLLVECYDELTGKESKWLTFCTYIIHAEADCLIGMARRFMH